MYLGRGCLATETNSHLRGQSKCKLLLAPTHLSFEKTYLHEHVCDLWMVHRQNHSTGERFRWSKIGSQVTSPTLPCKSECPLEWSESRYRTFQVAEYLVVYSRSSLYCHRFLPLSCLPPVLPPLSLDLCRLTASLWEVKGRWLGGVPSLRHNQILPTHPDWQPMLPWHNPPSVPTRLTYPLTLNMVCLSCSLASMHMILPPGIPSAHPDRS